MFCIFHDSSNDGLLNCIHWACMHNFFGTDFILCVTALPSDFLSFITSFLIHIQIVLSVYAFLSLLKLELEWESIYFYYFFCLQA